MIMDSLRLRFAEWKITKEGERNSEVILVDQPFSEPFEAKTDIMRFTAAIEKGGKDEQQDRVILIPELGFSMVVDGMGGYTNGGKAAQILAEVGRDICKNYREKLEDKSFNADDFRIMVDTIVLESSMRMKQAGFQEDGAAFAIAVVSGSNAHIAHMGDVRVMVVDRLSRSASFRTKDHTLAQDLIDKGSEVSEIGDKAIRSLLRVVTGEIIDDPGRGNNKPEISQFELKAGEIVVMFSDGVSDNTEPTYTDDEDLIKRLSIRSSKKMFSRLGNFIDDKIKNKGLRKERAKVDNYSMVAIELMEKPSGRRRVLRNLLAKLRQQSQVYQTDGIANLDNVVTKQDSAQSAPDNDNDQDQPVLKEMTGSQYMDLTNTVSYALDNAMDYTAKLESFEELYGVDLVESIDYSTKAIFNYFGRFIQLDLMNDKTNDQIKTNLRLIFDREIGDTLSTFSEDDRQYIYEAFDLLCDELVRGAEAAGYILPEKYRTNIFDADASDNGAQEQQITPEKRGIRGFLSRIRSQFSLRGKLVDFGRRVAKFFESDQRKQQISERTAALTDLLDGKSDEFNSLIRDIGLYDDEDRKKIIDQLYSIATSKKEMSTQDMARSFAKVFSDASTFDMENPVSDDLVQRIEDLSLELANGFTALIDEADAQKSMPLADKRRALLADVLDKYSQDINGLIPDLDQRNDLIKRLYEFSVSAAIATPDLREQLLELFFEGAGASLLDPDSNSSDRERLQDLKNLAIKFADKYVAESLNSNLYDRSDGEARPKKSIKEFLNDRKERRKNAERNSHKELGEEILAQLDNKYASMVRNYLETGKYDQDEVESKEIEGKINDWETVFWDKNAQTLDVSKVVVLLMTNRIGTSAKLSSFWRREKDVLKGQFNGYDFAAKIRKFKKESWKIHVEDTMGFWQNLNLKTFSMLERFSFLHMRVDKDGRPVANGGVDKERLTVGIWDIISAYDTIDGMGASTLPGYALGVTLSPVLKPIRTVSKLGLLVAPWAIRFASKELSLDEKKNEFKRKLEQNAEHGVASARIIKSISQKVETAAQSNITRAAIRHSSAMGRGFEAGAKTAILSSLIEDIATAVAEYMSYNSLVPATAVPDTSGNFSFRMLDERGDTMKSNLSSGTRGEGALGSGARPRPRMLDQLGMTNADSPKVGADRFMDSSRVGADSIVSEDVGDSPRVGADRLIPVEPNDTQGLPQPEASPSFTNHLPPEDINDAGLNNGYNGPVTMDQATDTQPSANYTTQGYDQAADVDRNGMLPEDDRPTVTVQPENPISPNDRLDELINSADNLTNDQLTTREHIKDLFEGTGIKYEDVLQGVTEINRGDTLWGYVSPTIEEMVKQGLIDEQNQTAIIDALVDMQEVLVPDQKLIVGLDYFRLSDEVIRELAVDINEAINLGVEGGDLTPEQQMYFDVGWRGLPHSQFSTAEKMFDLIVKAAVKNN